MPRAPAKQPSALRATKLRNEGKHAFGNGLYLQVSTTKAGKISKRWYWRGRVLGTRKEISIGPYSEYSLAEATEFALEWRKAAREGIDPKTRRDIAKQEVLSFEEAARKCYEEAIAPGLSNEKHSKQWIRTLETYAFPKIGKSQINIVQEEDIIQIMNPIWATKHETASRTLQRIRRIFEWARPRSDCSFDNRRNPANISKDALPIVKASSQNHHTALPYDELPRLMSKLMGNESISAYALQFGILTASRPIEVRGTKWNEIDWNKRLWTIPEERMKGRIAHKVPLSDRAIELLMKMKGLSSELVFPSTSDPNKMMSNSTMNALLVRMGVPREKATVHGFRSTFRDWTEEKTDFPHRVKESALAHKIKDKAEAAYNRTELLDKRRQLMDAWTEFATSG